MLTPTLSGPSGLAEFAESCAQTLFAELPHQFIFPVGCSLQHWPVDEIKTSNETFLKTLRHRANVYALSVRSSGGNQNWSPVYVGERKSAGLRDRITQHMITKDHRTGSMLEAVKTAVAAGQEIGVSFIKVEPESLRLFVEETIIVKHKNELPWNTHG
jgi:hypothetical protein